MYARSRLGTDETLLSHAEVDYSQLGFTENELISTQAPDVTDYPTPYPQIPSGSSWTWGSIWEPIETALKTGAEVFSKVYPAIKGREPTYTTGYPSPYPQHPRTSPAGGWNVNIPPPGYRIDPRTGRMVQAGFTDSPYFWPVILGVGGLALVTMTRRRS